MLERLLDIGALPVVSPISRDDAGTLLNINADTVASALSVALSAEELILLGEAPGLPADPEDPESVVSFLDLAGLEAMRACVLRIAVPPVPPTGTGPRPRDQPLGLAESEAQTHRNNAIMLVA